MKTVIGNWKMNLSIDESVKLARDVKSLVQGKKNIPNIVLCPSFLALKDVGKVLEKGNVDLGAQDMFWEEEGSYTGEVSPDQIKDVGATYVILGHSERRQKLGETDEMVNKKLKEALKEKITPIVCVGETKKQRDAKEVTHVLRWQVEEALKGVKLMGNQKLYFAYEPIWAIGTGVAENPEDTVEVHSLIRETAKEILGTKGKNVFVLYGGSVNEENALEFLREEEVDGVLVGGASIKIGTFDGIVRTAMEVMEEKENNKK